MSPTSASNECSRHGKAGPYYVRRCVHIGNRFVVEIRSSESNFIVVDYVEDLPADVIVDGRDVFAKGVDAREATAEALWQELTGYLFADVSPATTRE